ncbi:hypothetical protein [Nesterenkonia sp. F]|uniref:hypothetical protein n=1 Tax=Nesterenkonia sp. F TaxID=795955 RepID=UPI000255C934|nr:hypothetical protein [Nesterenkonia sp. F]
MRGKLFAGAVVALLLIFLSGAAISGIRFLTVDDLVARLIGVGTLLLVAVGVWVLVRELWFGYRSEQLGRELDAEGGLPEDTVDRSPGGRPDREQADAQFARIAAETEENPDDWRSWFRLSIGYDVASDRSRARKTMRRAIRMHSAERRAARRG